MTDLSPIRFWLESLIRPIIREVLTDELMDIHPTPDSKPNTALRKRGVKRVTKETGSKSQTGVKQVSKTSHRKLHRKRHYNRVQSRDYNNQKDASQFIAVMQRLIIFLADLLQLVFQA